MLIKTGKAIDVHGGMTKRLCVGGLAVYFGVVSTFGNSVLAQVGDDDFQAPIIEHELLGRGVWGDVEPFEATVVDDQEVKSVSFFYRFPGETEFTEISMTPLASSSSYMASVNTGETAEPVSAIEYYIRAEDTAGNLVLKGFSFQPLVRELVLPQVAAIADAPQVAGQEAVSTDDIEARQGVNWLYVALGALVLGGIAGAAGSGGGDEGGDVGGDGSHRVTLTIGTP